MVAFTEKDVLSLESLRRKISLEQSGQILSPGERKIWQIRQVDADVLMQFLYRMFGNKRDFSTVNYCSYCPNILIKPYGYG